MIYIKDRKIKIFKLVTERDLDGFVKTTKKYIHPVCKTLSAYFRTLKSSEIALNKQVMDDTEAIFIINRRHIEKDMYIEYLSRRDYGTTTYQITSVDTYDDSGNDIKLNAKKVNPPVYEDVEGTMWKC